MGLRRRSPFFVMIFGALSLHPKFRSQQPGFEREVGPQFRLLGRFNWDLGPARQLFWIEAKCVELPPPFSRRIAATGCRQECGGNWRSAGSENLNIACQAARSIG